MLKAAADLEGLKIKCSAEKFKAKSKKLQVDVQQRTRALEEYLDKHDDMSEYIRYYGSEAPGYGN